jgi:hypothetical protein
MGIFFDARKPDPRLVELLQTAMHEQPADVEREATALLGQFKPLAEPVKAALASPAPANPDDAKAAATAKAEALSNQLLGGSSFNTARFVVALVIFLALLGAAIGTDAAELKSSPAALYALATTVFGVVVGFLGSEKS